VVVTQVKVDDEDFSHKSSRSFPSRFKTLVTIIVREGLKNLTITQVLREVVTQGIFDQEEVGEVERDDKKKRALHSIPPLTRARKGRKNQVMMRIIEAQAWRRKKWPSL